MRTVPAAALAAVLAALPPAGAGAPQAPGQSTFRGRTSLVPLDVRVLDRRGQPVTDLTEADFTIVEDGVPQTISHFSRQALSAAAPPPAAEPSALPLLRRAAGAASGLEPQPHRVFLIVFGRGRLQYPARGVDGVLEFLRTRLLPQDYVAVMAWNRATDFTTDHAGAAAVVERFKARHERIDAQLRAHFSGLGAVYGSREIPERIQTAINEVFHGPGVPPVRELPPVKPPGGSEIDRDLRRTADALLRQQEIAARTDLLRATGGTDMAGLETLPAEGVDRSFDAYVETSAQTFQDLTRIVTGLEYLRYVEGEKHLVFLTEHGLYLPRAENERSLSALASDARVVIDTIHTGGLPPALDPATGRLAPMFDHTFAVGSLRTMATLTGGQASAYAYARDALDRVDRSTRFQYLIGYYPTNARWDGGFRRVRVRVNRDDVTVLVRNGYYGREDLEPLDRREWRTYNRVTAAIAYAPDIRDVRVRARAWYETGRDRQQDLVVDVNIEPDRVTFVNEDGRHAATLNVVFVGQDARGRPLVDLWRTMELRLRDEAYEQVKRDGLFYTLRVRMSGRPAAVKVVVYDYAADLLGTTVARVR